ncbi:RNA polymerase sigma factor [Neobacillus sp. D3-1R]|uniref:RNA polymerase sigma factor n=1 Tax=Neobacillus sp. D3-1R TaxID=3445778 RepID=UPI003FA122BE
MDEESNLPVELYEEYFDDVYQYLLYFTNNQYEAEDLTQETFIRVFKNYHYFKKQSSIKTWIFSIAKHVAIDQYRKHKLISIFPEFLLQTRKSQLGNPEREMENKADWKVLQEALSKLKPHYRNVVILRGLKECSVKETAEILNWKESKVKVNYHRALKLLKNHLKSDEGGVMYEENA